MLEKEVERLRKENLELQELMYQHAAVCPQLMISVADKIKKKNSALP